MDDVPEHLQKIYLSNALDQVLANPTAAHAWHHLAQHFVACGPQLQQQIVSLLHSNLPADGVVGFMRATFCASMTQQRQYFVEAGKILLKLQPIHLDRILAFLGYAWAKLLGNCENTQAFIADINAYCFPQLIQRCAELLAAAASKQLPARKIEHIKKVAVVGPHLSTTAHAPTRLLLQHAALWMTQGADVRAFSCQDLRITNMPQLFGNGEDFNLYEGDVEQWATLLPQPLSLHLGNTQLGLLRRYANMLEPLAEYDPDLIFFVGMYSPLIEVLFPQRPVLVLGVHALPPVASCDVWLAADASLAGSTENPWSNALSVGAAFPYSWRITLPPHQALNRLNVNVPPDAFILVCVGYRLGQEIAGEWAQRLCQFLAQRPDALLLLLGTADIPDAMQSVDSEQIIALGNQENVAGILDCCDIYLNPVRMGGGFSVLEAMAASLPVLALADGDGGKKLGEYAQPDLATYFAQLDLLSQDAMLRQQLRTGANHAICADKHAAP
ncbi:MAG: glycosyltransferase [Burkholderiales bacterium]|nr:glycosyltransferase [Burkholderiales bacterium]